MSADAAAPVNGTYAAPHPYPADSYNPNHAHMNNASYNNHVAQSTTTNTAPAQENKQDEIPKDEVGWYFVEQYYTTMSRSPEKLHLFYSRPSQFVFGNEAESVPVVVGVKAIAEKIKQLDFCDTKVRVLNVDSQASYENILVTVIGEISTRSQPSRKFTQTFVLAKQPNGYFVLNDIFRYLADEDEEFVSGEPQAQPAPEAPAAAPEQGAQKEETPAQVTSEEAASKVDQKLEEAVSGKPDQVAEPTVQANGEATQPEKPAVPATPAAPAVPAETQPEKPSTPQSTPVGEPQKEAAPPAEKEPAPPAKPPAPKTWANVASKVAVPAAVPPVPQKAPAPAPAQQQPQQPQQQPQQEQASTPAPTAAAAPAPSDTASAGQQSSDGAGWQTAGGDHGRRQPRAGEEQKVSAYIKNVTEKVDAAQLKATLSRFGKLLYFDVNRQKNCAFVDFADQAAYNAAVAANPHQVGSEQIYVEERRVRTGGFGNGYGRGGGRGRDGRAGSQGRGGGFQRDSGRGGFAPRGRGGFPAKNRGQSQAA
ncbi:hypothetical protein VTN49DRAFT_4503 [Thermomyces lanuginosus]|uniref:uncharacterized protein n=1 Tax=Thermomyces lanuginosus TaxID=5541 RepID=UPI0037449AC9